MSSLKDKECIAAFDPSHINKSGKKTYGKDRFWSGKDQRAKPGLEIGCLAMVDVEDATAYIVEAVQTHGEYERQIGSSLCGDHKEEYRSYTVVHEVSGRGWILYEENVY